MLNEQYYKYRKSKNVNDNYYGNDKHIEYKNRI